MVELCQDVLANDVAGLASDRICAISRTPIATWSLAGCEIATKDATKAASNHATEEGPRQLHKAVALHVPFSYTIRGDRFEA